MKRVTSLALIAAALTIVAMPAFAQVGVGIGGGTGIGDTIFNWFYTNFMHAIVAIGVIFCILGGMFMRKHIVEFVVVGICLLAIGNYSTILGWAGL